MTDISKLCMYCLNIKNENNICPYCKKEMEVKQDPPLLPLGCKLNNRYLIARAVKRNGEGITYLAYDLELDRAVSVREFFPEGIADRGEDFIAVVASAGSENTYIDCRREFLDLWSKLKRLKGLTSLISVLEVFQGNATAYAVYEESEAYTLRDYLLETQSGFVSWEKARIMFMPVLSTLGTLHTSGIIHRGLNPSSFIFSKDGRLKITDFCIEPQRRLFSELTPELFDGYAPLEQYSATGKVGAWSDIYAFCAVLYRALVGATPLDAKSRAQNDRMMIPAKFAEQLPPYVINAIINGMQIEEEHRTRNVEQLRSNLAASPRAVSASAQVYGGTAGTSQSIKKEPVRSGDTHVMPNTVKKNPYIEKTADYDSQPAAEQENNNKSKNKLIVTLCIIMACLLVAVGVLAVSLIKTSKEPENTTQAVETVDVPYFENMRITDIIGNSSYNSAFKITQVTQESDDVESGRVISQSIPMGKKVARGTEIVLYVSTGSKTTVIDDVTDKTYEEALQILGSKGILCKKSYKYNDGTHVPDTVAETFPPAGERVKNGETVQIILWQQLDETTTSEKTGVTSGINSVEDFLAGLFGN